MPGPGSVAKAAGAEEGRGTGTATPGDSAAGECGMDECGEGANVKVRSSAGVRCAGGVGRLCWGGEGTIWRYMRWANC